MHWAVRTLPAPPVNATAPHPPNVTPPSLKLTVPVGAVPVTVAVNVTDAPTGAGLAELASAVVVASGPLLMTCDSAGWSTGVARRRRCSGREAVRAGRRALVVHCAVWTLPEPPVNATAPQPPNVAPSSLKSTVPGRGVYR